MDSDFTICRFSESGPQISKRALQEVPSGVRGRPKSSKRAPEGFQRCAREEGKGSLQRVSRKEAPTWLGGASGLIWGATLAHLGATLANLGATLVHLHLAWSAVERQSQPILIASSMGTRIGAGISYGPYPMGLWAEQPPLSGAFRVRDLLPVGRLEIE